MKRSHLIAAAIAAAVAGWIASGQFGDGEPSRAVAASPDKSDEPLTQVRVRTIEAVERGSELVLFGHSEAERNVELKAETSGRVVTRTVKKGGRVRKGDLIVSLAMDDRLARLAETVALLEHHRIVYQADQKLSEKQFRSKIKMAETRASLETAKAALQNIRLDIERTSIRAPFDGVVDDLPMEVGDYVAVGGTVARIVDLDPILIVGEVTERDASRITVGGNASVVMPNGATIAGKVRYVSKVGSPLTRTFRIEIEVGNSDGSIAEGMTAELHLDLGRVKAHRVSPAVLTLSDQGVVGVKTVDTNGVVAFVAVKMIGDTPEGIWLSGLPQRATLITVGQEFVLPGQRVAPVPETKKTGP